MDDHLAQKACLQVPGYCTQVLLHATFHFRCTEQSAEFQNMMTMKIELPIHQVAESANDQFTELLNCVMNMIELQ